MCGASYPATGMTAEEKASINYYQRSVAGDGTATDADETGMNIRQIQKFEAGERVSWPKNLHQYVLALGTRLREVDDFV